MSARQTPDHETDSGLGVLQGDLSMNFFMILMVILATLTIASVAVITEGFPVRMEREPPADPPLGLIKSWTPVRELRPKLLIRDGQVHRMQLDSFATLFAKGEKYAPELGIDASNHLPQDPDPTAHMLVLQLGSARLPEDLYSWRLPAEAFAAKGELPAEVIAELQTMAAADIYLYEGDEEAAWDLGARLSELNTRLDFHWLPKGLFGYRRQSGDFLFVDTYK